MSFGILGFGEVGSSLKKVYELAGRGDEVVVRDPCKGFDSPLSGCDIVNVCIPFSSGHKHFASVLRGLGLRPGCVVMIQSTVGFGCTDSVQAEIPGVVCVHSPVRGVHPNLAEGILAFEKYVGLSDMFFNDESAKSRVTDHLRSLNIRPVVCRSKESELAKIVSTTLYGLNIAAITDVSRMCDKRGVDFGTVFTRWQMGYNAGYRALGMPNVCRPVLTPIPISKEGEGSGGEKRVIGGHCVLPNCAILRDMGEPTLPEFVLRYSDETSLTHRSAESEG